MERKTLNKVCICELWLCYRKSFKVIYAKCGFS